jgi:hypothetical protein
MVPSECARESGQDAIGAICEHAIGESCDRILFMQHQRFRGGDTHQRARKRSESAKTEHDVRSAATDDPAALPACACKREGAHRELA